MFQRFCETNNMMENWERSGRFGKITEEKIDEVHHAIENQQAFKLLQRLALFPEQQHTEL